MTATIQVILVAFGIHAFLGFWKVGKWMLQEFVDSWIYFPVNPQEVHRPWVWWRILAYVVFSLLWLPLFVLYALLGGLAFIIVVGAYLLEICLEKKVPESTSSGN